MSVRLPKQSENNRCQFRNGWPCCRKTGTQENRTAHTKAERKPARDRDRGKLKDRRLIDMPAVGAARRERKCIYAAESTSVWVMGFLTRPHPLPGGFRFPSCSLEACSCFFVYAKSRTIPILSGWRHASFNSSVAVWFLLFNSLIRSVLQLWISLVRWYLFKLDIQFSLAQSINELEYSNNRQTAHGGIRFFCSTINRLVNRANLIGALFRLGYGKTAQKERRLSFGHITCTKLYGNTIHLVVAGILERF